MNVMELVKPYEDPQTANYKHHFRVEATTLYPKMIDEIRDVIKEGPEKARARLNGERLNNTPIVTQYLPRALRVATVGWEAALAAPTDDMSDDIKQQRNEALEVARLWFLELLHVAVHHEPMVVHTTKDHANIHRPSR